MDELYYNPVEVAGIGSSYLGLGGETGTGMKYNDWLSSQGIGFKDGKMGLASTFNKNTGGIMGGLSNWADKNKFGIGLIGGIADLGMGLAKYGLTKKYLESNIAGINEDIAAKRQKIASRNGIQAAFSGVRV